MTILFTIHCGVFPIQERKLLALDGKGFIFKRVHLLPWRRPPEADGLTECPAGSEYEIPF